MRIIEQLISENTGPFRLYVFLIPAKCSEFGGLEFRICLPCRMGWPNKSNGLRLVSRERAAMTHKAIVAAFGLGLLAGCGPGQSVQNQPVTEEQNSDVAVQSAKTLAEVATPNLPQRMSTNITWSQSFAVGDRFVMSYVVHHNFADVSPIINDMKNAGIIESTSRLCNQLDSRKALDIGVVYVYTFISQDSQALYEYEISKQNCA